MILRVILLSLVVSLMSPRVDAQQEFFPFVGEIKTDNVNVRAGQSENFERLCRLDKGSEVLVLGRSYSWYKVQLPSFAKSYVSTKYVHLVNNKTGGIIGNKVNVRAGAGENYTVLGQVTAGEEVKILETGDQWHKIEPLKDSFGWVHEDFILFKSKDISSFHQPVQEKKEGPVKEVKAVPTETAIAVADKIQTGHAMSVTGVLEAEKNAGGIHYKLKINGKAAYFLKGMEHILDSFLNYRVDVDGIIDTGLKDKYELPVLSVTRIQLVL